MATSPSTLIPANKTNGNQECRINIVNFSNFFFNHITCLLKIG